MLTEKKKNVKPKTLNKQLKDHLNENLLNTKFIKEAIIVELTL